MRWREPIPLVFLVALVTNALVSYAYLKTEIMSVAGVLYALAAFVAMREVLGRTRARTRAAAVVLCVLLTTISGAWAVRSAGLHFKLRHGAFDARGGWAEVLPPADRDQWPGNPQDVALLERLKQEAVTRRNVAATALPRAYQRWWGQD
jgi:hypothetical protein